MPSRSAADISNWLLMWADAEEGEDAGLTNLKLQKLLYYAQGHFLAKRGEPLFAEDIQAWAHGPVVPGEYHRLKTFGRGPIDVNDVVPDEFDWDDYRDVEQHLIEVWNTYGRYAAWALRQKTHQESPWLDAFNEGEYGVVIRKADLQSFFERV